MRNITIRVSAAIAGVLLLGSVPARAQSGRLGTIVFPTSGAPEAQTAFLRGVAWLHSFEYEEAFLEFRDAQRSDPDFAMAYWGEAMAYNQTLWFARNMDSGRAALERLGPTREARLAKAPSPRERGFLDAVEVLYADGEKRERDEAYAARMAELREAFPDDDEVAAFYALALLGTVRSDELSFNAGMHEGPMHSDPQLVSLPGSELQRQAAAALEAILDRNPEHPGALHYLIHTYDDPEHAPLALPAALSYAKVAPSAPHALHMPAHIFVQLGRWHDAVSSDEAAFAASDALIRLRGLPLASRSYHSLSWLEYGYLQEGRYGKARETLDIITPVAAQSGDGRVITILASMKARYVLDTRQWTEYRGVSVSRNLDELFVIGVANAYMNQLRNAEIVRAQLAGLVSAERYANERSIVSILERNLAAIVAVQQGRSAEGLAALDQAIAIERDLPPPMGLPRPLVSPSELKGELLLAQGRDTEAEAAFRESLERQPKRSASLLGLARALDGQGAREEAREIARQLLDNWRDADAGVPGLEQARALAEE